MQASCGHADSILDEKQTGGSGGETTKRHGELVVAEPASATLLDGEDSSVDDSVGASVVDEAEDSVSVEEAV